MPAPTANRRTSFYYPGCLFLRPASHSENPFNRVLQQGKTDMENQVKRINPPDLAAPNGFIHVAVAPPVPMVVVSGQVSCDSHGNIVGVDELEAQTRQVLAKLRTALQSAGLAFRHWVKLTFFLKS